MRRAIQPAISLERNAVSQADSPLLAEIRNSSWFRGLRGHPVRTRPHLTARIAEIAALHADAVAIREDQGTCSYGELVALAIAQRRLLERNGVNPGDVVALSGPVSIPFVSAMLGTWLAGAIAFPIDAAAPSLRNRALIAQTGTRHLFATGGVAAQEYGVPVIDACDAGAFVSRASTGDVDAVVNAPLTMPDAYIFCSSGSTGTPKAILGNHAGLSHFLAWQRDVFRIGPSDHCLVTTNTTFDVVLRDIFLVLTAGGCLHVAPNDMSNPLTTCAERAITCLHVTPTRLQAWLQARGVGEPLSALRHVFSAGEPMPAEVAALLHATAPNVGLVNLYGPTETTLAKFFHRVDRHAHRNPVPVGRPLDEVRCHVLGDDLKPCMPMQVGEVVIQTPYRSSGYLGATADQTARFVDIPGSADGVYFTGDLGFVDEAGVLTLSGRKDDQVKIRGVLVNPAEIEALLNDVAGILRTKVLPVGDTQLSRRLVAFYVPAGDAPLDARELGRHLAERLPPALIPRQFIPVRSMPMTANGKVDKARLLDSLTGLRSTRPGRSGDDLGARVAEFLHDIGVCGGDVDPDSLLHVDSLAAIALGHFLEHAAHCAVPAVTLAQCDSLSAIMAAVSLARREYADAAAADAAAADAAAADAGDDARPRLFAFPPLSGWGLIFKGLEAALPDYAVTSFDFIPSKDPPADYAERIARATSRQPVTLLGYSAGGNLAYEVTQRLESMGVEVRRLVLMDTAPRTHVIRRGEAELEQYAGSFVDYLFDIGFLSELAASLAGIVDVRRVAERKIVRYRNYLDGVVHDRPINADILLLSASSASEVDRDVARMWRRLSTGTVSELGGHGHHLAMLDRDNVHENAALIVRATRSAPGASIAISAAGPAA
ncbi:AMP-binding protein [Burkholderia ubonensis]|uniref:AMP-binding protein n=1 Tax=Burkholderia ubonensis TaxID=101571 RepID=UPI0012FC7518|nr:AMP-binding protein [Burkholderia ubonensis]